MKETKLYRKRIRVAKRIILTTRNTSTSCLQRKMKISYNDAAKLMADISKLNGFKFLYWKKGTRSKKLSKKIKK